MTSSIYSAEEFWPAFTRDIKAAYAHIIIQSPFLAARRIKAIANDIRAATAGGVTVCAIVQEPPHFNAALDAVQPEITYNLQEFRLVVEMLRSLGAHVNLRKNIHAKLALIDDRVLWEGSLNILSHASTKEHMRRWNSLSQIRCIAEKHKLTCSECETNNLHYGTFVGESHHLAQFGSLLAAQRQRLRLSRRAFANKCGFPRSTIERVESGKDTRLSTILQVVQMLQLELVILPTVLHPSVARLLARHYNSPESKI